MLIARVELISNKNDAPLKSVASTPQCLGISLCF